MILLVATEVVRASLPDFRWRKTSLARRNSGARPDAYWTVTEGSPPDGFTEDDRTTWLIDGVESRAFMSADVLRAWRSDGQHHGNFGKSPRILFDSRPPPTVQDVLAKQKLDTSSVIPPSVNPSDMRQSRSNSEACRRDLDIRYREFVKWLANDVRETTERRGRKGAEIRKEMAEIARTYGQPAPTITLPMA